MKISTAINTKNISSPTDSKQQGAVLLISIVVLLILTILGVSAMRNTVMEEKMVGNMRDKGLSFQAAEATLRYAEKYIEDNIVSTNAFDTNTFDSTYNVAEPPRFIIQHLSSIATNQNNLNLGNYGQNTGAGTNEIFLITARATGGSGDAPVILQTTYGKIL